VIATEGLDTDFDGIVDEGVDTTLIDLAADMGVVISGKNQTCGDDDSNNDQLFGHIHIFGADGATLDVTLDNTARVEGELSVEHLWIDDESATNLSAVRTVNLESAGGRDTSNLVKDFEAERVTTLNLLGTQNLAIHVSEMATLPVTGGTTPTLAIDGSELEGDLLLALNAADLDRANLDVLTGTEGENDLLALYGAEDDLNTSISGFETIQFGWTGGSDLDDTFDTGSLNALTTDVTFDAGNTTGVDTFVIALRGGGNAFTLDNLADGVNVVLGDESGGAVLFGEENTLIAASGGTLDLVMSDVLGSNTVSRTNIDGFDTVNLDVAATTGDNPLNDLRRFNLDFANDTTTLVVTGSDEEGGVELVNGLEAS
jgi:hypothetical protein